MEVPLLNVDTGTYMNIFDVSTWMCSTSFYIASIYNTVCRKHIQKNLILGIEEIDKELKIISSSSKMPKRAIFLIFLLLCLGKILIITVIYNQKHHGFFLCITYGLDKCNFYFILIIFFLYIWELTDLLARRYARLKELIVLDARPVPKIILETDIRNVGVIYGKLFVVTQQLNVLFGKNLTAYFCYIFVASIQIILKVFSDTRHNFTVCIIFSLQVTTMNCVSMKLSNIFVAPKMQHYDVIHKKSKQKLVFFFL